MSVRITTWVKQLLGSQFTYDERVDAGVVFLDRKYSRDVWLNRVDVDYLRVGSSDDCVLAQVTGRSYDDACFDLGLVAYGPTAVRARNMGFLDYANDFSGNLQNAWVTRLRELQRVTA